MAIRRPSISSPEWLFQDFLYQEATGPGGSELRYLQIKWDGDLYTQVSQSYDYSDPPYVGPEQRGGSIVGQVDYEVNVSTRLVIIYSWSVNWRDEWPLRLAVNYLSQCLYPALKGYTILVAGDEVYTQAGDALQDPNNFPYAFWASEQFNPLSGNPHEYLVRVRPGPSPINPTPSLYQFNAFVEVTVPRTYINVTIISSNTRMQTPLYWKLTGGITPAMLTSGFTTGVVLLNSAQEFLKLTLERPVPSGVTGYFEFYLDADFTESVGSTPVTL